MILDKINCPKDIKNLSTDQLKELCGEIRAYMISCCSTTPGHLGSSLGAVELIVGMHYVFDAPSDKLVFDVSHQAYAHKILTCRREAFRKLRTKDGINGFTKMDESPYDAFGAGHSSTSISAALGLAVAAKMKGGSEKVVALIGDGAMTGGLAFEGLNNAGDSASDLLVILNDNNMSIDDIVGGMHNHLLSVTTAPFYNTMKNKIWSFLGEGKLRKRVQNAVIKVKSGLVQHSGGDFFESMGLRYFGPIDGNDIESVVNALKRIKELKGPRILHAITKKGKGYAPAEEDQTVWHAPGLFDPVSGKRIKIKHDGCRYQDVFGEVLLQLARQDSRVVGITPAMASGCGMNILAKEMPERFFDVGIAEEHAVTFSAGLAAGGMKPFCNIYSSFFQRAMDQAIHDVALQKLPVVICLDRAGLVGEDGATHHGAFDMSMMRCIPNCTICAPRNELELQNLMYSGLNAENGPYIIRYPRGWAEGVEWRGVPFEAIPSGKACKLMEGRKVAVVALGPVANRAFEAFENSEFKPAIWDARFLKPFDNSIADDILSGLYDSVVTIEDGAVTGGLFSQISEIVARSGKGIRVIPIGLPDRFIEQDTQSGQREEFGLSRSKIHEKVLELIK